METPQNPEGAPVDAYAARLSRCARVFEHASFQFMNIDSVSGYQDSAAMLATFNAPSSSSPSFLPAVPSPLSPRRAHGRHQQDDSRPFYPTAFMNPGQGQTPQFPSTGSRDQPRLAFSSRSIKAVPTAQKAGKLREQRREFYLNKVKQGRDDSRWESRIEDVSTRPYQPIPVLVPVLVLVLVP